MILRIALPTPLDKLFDYQYDGALAPELGSRVQVLFSGRKLQGFVAEIADHSEIPAAKLKRIDALIDANSLFSTELWSSLNFAARYYQHSLGEVISQALPLSLRKKNAASEAPGQDYLMLTPEAKQSWQAIQLDSLSAGATKARKALAKTALQADLIDLLGASVHSIIELDERLPGWRKAFSALRKRALVERFRVSAFAPPQRLVAGPPLNAEQAQVLNALEQINGYQAVLLYGVTGSGKTEVYLQAIKRVLAQGKQALVLVPEIGLTPQTVQRFKERLNARVGVLHSGLSESERAHCWHAARDGQLDIVIGTRSAVFCQFPNLGLIVVDEEHDSSYKQQEGFRYHARDFALKRGQTLAIAVLLGSATPALETLRNVQLGRIKQVELSQRAGSAQMPKIGLIDLRMQSQEDGLSKLAEIEMRSALSAGGQVLVFRNRRGFAPQLSCEACGHVPHCSRCEQAMTIHRRAAQLRCHYCGASERLPEACSVCGSEKLVALGAGTERIHDALTQRFPEWPCIRIDRDSTRNRGVLERELAKVRSGLPCILVGTQMLAKGHDFPNLTLVVAVGADSGLHSLDFRAAERLSQLLFQVAGRAGRGVREGRVLVQTQNPQHELLELLLKQDYAVVAEHLLAERKAAQFPPYTSAVMLRAESLNQMKLQEFLLAARAALPVQPLIQCYGPMPALIAKRAMRYRAQLVLCAESRPLLHQNLRSWRAQLTQLSGSGIHFSIDIDPMDFS